MCVCRPTRRPWVYTQYPPRRAFYFLVFGGGRGALQALGSDVRDSMDARADERTRDDERFERVLMVLVGGRVGQV
eukprot:1195557-Prorocentrum_minimum.AAC.1